jgi:RNase P subunit RPR2
MTGKIGRRYCPECSTMLLIDETQSGKLTPESALRDACCGCGEGFGVEEPRVGDAAPE